MKYDNKGVRRQDRLLDEKDARTLLRNGEYGVLSMCAAGGIPYGIPFSYVWDGNDSIYFHCATEGKKLHVLNGLPSVSFCVVGKTKVIPDKLTTAYESILLSGNISLVTDDEQRVHALGLLMDKYAPQDKALGMRYAEKSFYRTLILRLDITGMSGKCKR